MSALSAYNHGSTAPARHPAHERRRDLRVVPGRANHRQTLSPTFVMAAKLIAVALVIFAGLSFARIALNSATVASALESQRISASVDTARSEASSLEIRQSALASPDRIKNEATELGMIAPVDTYILHLKPDVLSVTPEGRISLSGSVDALTPSG